MKRLIVLALLMVAVSVSAQTNFITTECKPPDYCGQIEVGPFIPWLIITPQPKVKPKCEDIGFEHAWREEDRRHQICITQGWQTICPPRVRICANCGKRQQWIEPDNGRWEDVPLDGGWR